MLVGLDLSLPHLRCAVEGADAAQACAAAAQAASRWPPHHKRCVCLAGRRLPRGLGGVEAVQTRELGFLEIEPLQNLVVRSLRASRDVACLTVALSQPTTCATAYGASCSFVQPSSRLKPFASVQKSISAGATTSVELKIRLRCGR